MRALIGLGLLLLISGVVVGPVVFQVLSDPAPASSLTSLRDRISWVEWQPLSVQVTVAVSILAVLALAWLAIRLGMSLLAKAMGGNGARVRR